MFPLVTNHHIVIKDRLMLIFCVYRPTAIKRQQHSVNLYYAALTSSMTQVPQHTSARTPESDECAAYLLIEQQWDSNLVRLRPIRTHDILQRQDTWAKGNYAARWAELFMQMWSGRVWNGLCSPHYGLAINANAKSVNTVIFDMQWCGVIFVILHEY